MKRLLSLLGLAAVAFSAQQVEHAYATETAHYAEVVPYSSNAWLKFPDFSIRYIGTRVVPPGKIKLTFTFYQFDVQAGGKTQRVEWSSGTGSIGPRKFTVDGKEFYLELMASMYAGAPTERLNDNELVITPAEKYHTDRDEHFKLLNKKNG